MTGRHLGCVPALAILACFSAGLPKAPAPDLYVLDPKLPASASAVEVERTAITVATPRAVPGLESRGMVYVQREHQIRYFARSAWVEPPARMLAPLLARALEADGRFRAVRDGATDPAARLRLETDVLKLQQEFTTEPSRVRIVLRVRLLDVAARRILGQSQLEVIEPAPSEDPYGGVVAANAAAARAVGDIAAACASWAGAASATAQGSSR